MNNISEIIDPIHEELILQRSKLRKRLRSLRKHKGFYLTCNSKRGHIYYSQNITLEGERSTQYLGKADNPIVHALQEYKYIEEALCRCENNLQVISDLTEKYMEISTEAVSKCLGKAYQTSSRPIESVLNVKVANDWVKEQEAAKAKYPIFHPEGLKHSASNGDRLRSKAEVIIHDEMILMEVPFVYECPITINGTTYLPDFIAYDERNQRIIIIEYFGMFNNPDYAQAAFKKIMDYYQAGFTPGVNFLMFFDDTFGNIDAAVIRQQLKAVFR